MDVSLVTDNYLSWLKNNDNIIPQIQQLMIQYIARQAIHTFKEFMN